jgi:hypothetical protein
MDSYNASDPNQSHGILAQIKTLDAFKSILEVIINEESQKIEVEAKQEEFEKIQIKIQG